MDSDLLTEQARRLIADGKVEQAMELRCQTQGHEWENGADIMFNVYQFCRWCGAKK
jgi:hypothetical protein